MSSAIRNVAILLCASVLVLGGPLRAADYTWTNGVTALWTATNAWSPTAPTGGPTASDNVIGTTGSNLQLNAGTYNINNFTATTTTGPTWALQSGATGASTLNVAGTFTMDSDKNVFVMRNAGASTGTLTLNAANISVVNTNGALFLGNTGDANSLHAVSVSGSTTVNAGTRLRMNVTNSANLGALTANGLVSLVTTTNNDISRTVTVTSLAGAGTVNGNASSGLNSSATLIINGASTTTFSGIIANGNDSVVSLTKSGSGVQTLTGNNTFSGGLILGQGTLRMGHVNAAGSGTITQSTNNSTLQINTTGTVTNAMSIFNIQTLQTVTLSGNKTLNNATYTVDPGTTTTESGVLSGDGGITKLGTGTLVLAGVTNNTYTGATVVGAGSLVLSNSGGNAIHSSSSITVDSGASLVLGASNQIGDGIGLVLNGGTLLVGAADVIEELGTLTLSASSTIDFGNFGSTLRQLTFDNSTAVTWATNAVLTITNWQGVANTSSEFTEILFGVGGLTAVQQGQIRFANQDNAAGILLDNGELAPIPEAPVVWGAAALAAFVLWRERRHVRSVLGAMRSKSARGGRARAQSNLNCSTCGV